MANVLVGTGTDHEVDPISRIEGHLGVKVRVGVGAEAGRIIDANAHGNLWRGFENFLLGRDINDAITFVQRICGVCPVPHGLASTHAVDNVMGYSRGHITFKTALETPGVGGVPATFAGGTYGVPEKAVLIRNLVLGAEFLMSSITHFYHLAAPSYVQGPAIPPWTPFFDNSYYHAVLRNPGGATALPNVDPTSPTQTLWDAVIYSYVKALKIRRMTFEAAALFAGRMPMTSCYVGGGVSNAGTENLTAKINQYREIMKSVAAFVISEYIPIALALGALYPDFDHQGTGSLGVVQPTLNGNPRGAGAGTGRFLSWGAFPGVDAAGTLLLPGGVKDLTVNSAVEDALHFTVLNKADVYAKFLGTGPLSVPMNLTEDIVNSRYIPAADDSALYALSASGSVAYPGKVARTRPKRDKGYSYMKSPRWATKSCEVGPFARMVVAGYYPTDGTTSLITTFPFAEYIYTVGGTIAGGLDLSVIDANIVNGLLNTNPDGTTGGAGPKLASIVKPYIEGLTGGLSTIDRLRGRALESAVICVGILGAPTKVVGTPSTFTWANTGGWLGALAALTGTPAQDTAGSTWATKSVPLAITSGWGATEAPRGALMHQATIKAGKIQKYQCIVPTTWNGSPKDNLGARGAIEEAMVGAPFAEAPKTTDPHITSYVGGVEVLRIAQSFDPCIACAIH